MSQAHSEPQAIHPSSYDQHNDHATTFHILGARGHVAGFGLAYDDSKAECQSSAADSRRLEVLTRKAVFAWAVCYSIWFGVFSLLGHSKE
jgi:hypothetical protein